jgi:predicted Zn-dependent protease
MRPRIVLLLALSLAAAACGGEGEPVRNAEIEDWERELGVEQHPKLLAEFGGAYAGDEADYLARVGSRVAGAAGLGGQCTFTLVNTDVVNAFAVPGCYIYLTRGLFALVNSEGELASVLAHELGHIVADHGERQQRRSFWRSLGVLAVNLVTGSERLTRIAAGAAELFTLRYSRKQEFESDDLAIGFMTRAGYNPYATVDMLGALARHEGFMNRTRGRDEASTIPEWARTHPLTASRIERSRQRAEATGLGRDALPENVASYLNSVDGLLYGDDPRQGFVTGRRFAHPVMRIAFEAPPGFTLINSPAAILIEGPDGLRGEFAGGRLPPSGLEGYVGALAGQLLQGTPGEIGPAQRQLVNGVPALFVPIRVATERGRVQLQIAAFDGGGGDAYHFVILTPPGQGAQAAAGALFRSFRLLSPQQAEGLRPRAIDVIAVGPGETVASLARRMATDHAQEHFLTLNGLASGDRLQPGTRVKIVTLANP